MCCLFGLFDYKRRLTGEQKTQVVRVLAAVAEARGTDASGIAYNVGGQLRIVKSPGPAHEAGFRVPDEADVIMGHTRMTTPGSAKMNRNNHPFSGQAGHQRFALAHNGVLTNDAELRRQFQLPTVKIETDSYIAVQLIERENVLDFRNLRNMAELLEGSFTITVLNAVNDLFVVKGDSPFCLYHYPKLGIYLYASTEEILRRGLEYIQISGDAPEKILLDCGEILRIQHTGELDKDAFDSSNLFRPRCFIYGGRRGNGSEEWLEELFMVAGAFGYTPEDLEELLAEGCTTEELEAFLYDGEL
ncbi:MAG: class II glutamine amidotransferase [Oscillibacter sp.]|nr:class II glutamine amidotransferase [Oscillibacter sp.]